MIVRELVFKLGFNAQQAQRSAQRFDRTVEGIKGRLVDMGKAAVVAAGVAAYAAFRMSDDYLLLQSRLKQVVKDQRELASVSEELFQIAQRQRQPIQAVTDLYIKATQATKDLGFAQEDTAKLVEAFSSSLILSGAKGPAAEAAILQFSQGLSSQKLSGDEYKTLRETNAQFLEALMAGSGKNRAELDAMAEGGLLTPEFIYKSTLNQYEDLVKRAAQVRRTVPQAGLQVLNSLQKRIGQIAEKSDAFDKVVRVFDKLRNIIESPRFERTMTGIVSLFSALLDILITAVDVIMRVIDAIGSVIDAVGGLEKALRILGSVILAIIVRRMWMMIAAFASYIKFVGLANWMTYVFAGGVAFLTKAFRILMASAPWLLLIAGLALVIEDLWAFVQGNESVIGRLIDAWDDYVWLFKEMWGGLKEWFDGIISWFTDKASAIANIATKAMRFFPSGSLSYGAAIGNQMVNGARGGAGGTIMNVKNDVKVEVPVGTSQEQAMAIEKQVRDAMADQLLTTYRQTLNDFPEVE